MVGQIHPWCQPVYLKTCIKHSCWFFFLSTESLKQTGSCVLAHSVNFLLISSPQNHALFSGFTVLLPAEAMSVFLLFLHACFFFHIHTRTLPLDQNSAKPQGNAGLWMHQCMPQFQVAYSQLPLAAVKPHHFSEVGRNQNNMSSCFTQRHLLWAVFWFTAVLHSTQSVQRDRKYPAVCTKEFPDSTGAGLGLFDTSLQVSSKEERPGCDCSLKYAWASWFKGRSHFRLYSWKILRGSKWDPSMCIKITVHFLGLRSINTQLNLKTRCRVAKCDGRNAGRCSVFQAV